MMTSKRVIVYLMFGTVFAGCSREPNARVELAPTNTVHASTAENTGIIHVVAIREKDIDEAQAVEIARLVVTTNETRALERLICSARTNATGWRVLVVSKPLMPGSHWHDEIDKVGKVISHSGEF